MPAQATRTEVLQPTNVRFITGAHGRRTQVFWELHLSQKMSRYTFEQALLGRPSSPETVTAIIEAVEAEAERLWLLIRDELGGDELAAFVRERGYL